MPSIVGAAPALANPACLLHADNLSKRYGSLWALRGASFAVNRGEILGLIGPNGSGKTTLFTCLAGLTPATLGSVETERGELAPDDRKGMLFYVPDGIRPWPDQQVAWVLEFIAGIHGTSRDMLESVIEDLALHALRGARMRELSKGEHKRVLLAMGLLTPQPVLLLDEPFDGLDLRQTRDVMRVLESQVSTGRTLFLSIHQLADAARICNRLILLSGGEVVGEGTLDALRAKAGVAEGGVEEVFLALT